MCFKFVWFGFFGDFEVFEVFVICEGLGQCFLTCFVF